MHTVQAISNLIVLLRLIYTTSCNNNSANMESFSLIRNPAPRQSSLRVRHHPTATVPNTLSPFAPLTEGKFPGSPSKV